VVEKTAWLPVPTHGLGGYRSGKIEGLLRGGQPGVTFANPRGGNPLGKGIVTDEWSQKGMQKKDIVSLRDKTET